MSKIAFWTNVFADDWTAERAIIASNDAVMIFQFTWWLYLSRCLIVHTITHRVHMAWINIYSILLSMFENKRKQEGIYLIMHVSVSITNVSSCWFYFVSHEMKFWESIPYSSILWSSRCLVLRCTGDMMLRERVICLSNASPSIGRSRNGIIGPSACNPVKLWRDFLAYFRVIRPTFRSKNFRTNFVSQGCVLEMLNFGCFVSSTCERSHCNGRISIDVGMNWHKNSANQAHPRWTSFMTVTACVPKLVLTSVLHWEKF